MGTELGRTLSAKEPKCVGEVLRFVNEGRGGCKTTQTCCCPPPGGEEMLLLLLFWLEGKLRSPFGLSWLSILSTENRCNYFCRTVRLKRRKFPIKPNYNSNIISHRY